MGRLLFVPLGIAGGFLARLVERGSRVGFQRATGRWPGEERPEAT
jgi:hypothetical protein